LTEEEIKENREEETEEDNAETPDISPSKKSLANGEDKTGESTEGDEEEESEVEAQYECAIMLALNFDGQGITVNVVDSEQVARKATPDDVLSMIGNYNLQLQSNLVMAKFMNMFGGKMKRTKKGGIVLPGR